MSELHDQVKLKLNESGSTPETIALWESIAEWYADGGPDAVNNGIKELIKAIKEGI